MLKSMVVEPVTLESRHVRLEPMGLHHLAGLCDVGLEPSLWEHTANVVANEADIARYVRSALADQACGIAMPFVTIESATHKIVGSTRFGNIDITNRKTEIGWTWIAPPWQRTAINTEAKLVMLTHAFEVWGCIRVELKTDANNVRSRDAMRRIGCIEEGILRNHMITERGRFRDTVYYSIIESEWPVAKQALIEKLGDRDS